jgi:superfamily II DNA/RNA helicase
MVATDVAARGIDVERIARVINFDLPGDHDAYTHRVGRTGRAGRDGTGISFVLPDQHDEMRAIAKHVGLTETLQLTGTSGNYTVLVITAAGIPEPRPVTVGLMTSSLVEIKSGLNAGDVVVTGTASQQRAGTTTGTQGNGFVVPGGGGGFRGGPGN